MVSCQFVPAPSISGTETVNAETIMLKRWYRDVTDRVQLGLHTSIEDECVICSVGCVAHRVSCFPSCCICCGDCAVSSIARLCITVV